MKEIIDVLRERGCDMDGAMERFLEDEEFYCECLSKALSDASFDNLGSALADQRLEDAFNQAHTLKGLIANMGLTPLYDIVVRIVEPLRVGNMDDLLSIYEELLEERKGYLALIEE